MSKIKLIESKKKVVRHFKNVGYVIPSCFSKKDKEDFENNIEKCYTTADKELKSFHREGTKLMKKLSKIIDRAVKTDPYSSVFVMRAAEFMVADWLNVINPHVKYGLKRN